MSAKYVELHARSAFSFLEGASLPEDLASRCAELGQSAMAITDTHGVYGSPRFHLAAKKLGIRALIGAEVNNTYGSRLTLLAESQKGYQNLCRLITRTKFRSGLPGKAENPYATDLDFAEYASELVCLTGGDEGPLANAFQKSNGPEAASAAREQLERLIHLFGEKNVFVELQRHYRRDQEERNQALIELAANMNMPLLATNGVTQEIPERRPLQDVLTALHYKTTLSEAGKLLSINTERHMKSSAEMARLFQDVPEAVANSVELADRLRFTLKDLGYQFPSYPVPAGENQISYLRQLTERGAHNRYQPYGDKERRQIERELVLIEKLKLAGYFLIVWDIVEFCRREKILVQGRGSAANSAVCYALGITAVDPVRMDLLFERFLSEERGEMPDIDLDLPSGDQRERAIQYLYQQYGRLGAAMTANVITYRGRSAVRDVRQGSGFQGGGNLSACQPD
jgi:error-prone DNA polymerase